MFLNNFNRTIPERATFPGFLLSLLLFLLFFGMYSSAANAQYDLLVSSSSSRSSPLILDGKTISGNIYVYIGPETGISQVRFYLDDPTMSGSPRQTESNAPYDFAGTAGDGSAKSFNTATLSDGPHSITASISLSAGGTDTVTANFTVNNASPAYQLQVSTSSNRSSPVALQGFSASGLIYIFMSPESGIQKVEFFLDNTAMTGTPRQTERTAPYDFAGTASNGTANPFDVSGLSSGAHTVTARITLSTGSTTSVSSSFSVGSVADTSPPTVPQNVAAIQSGAALVQVSWSASTDVGGGVVSGYNVFRADIGLIGTVTGTSFSDSSVVTGNTYDYTVTAFDNSSPVNESAPSSPPASVTVSNSNAGYQLLVSTSSNRSSPVALQGFSASGLMYIFISPESGIQKVEFFLDNTAMTGTPRQTERTAPYDFAGTASNGTANPFDVSGLSSGTHTVSARITLSSGSTTSVTSSFSVGSGGVTDTSPPTVPQNVSAIQSGATQVQVSWSASTDVGGGVVAGYKVYRADIGLVGTVTTGLTLNDTSVVVGNSYNYTVSAFDNATPVNESAQSSPPASVTIGGCSSISPLPCSSVRLNGDYLNSFTGDANGIVDASGVGTGFTMIDPPSKPGNPSPNPVAPGYWPAKLSIDTGAGKLRIAATPGIQYLNNNNLDNALGVGLNLPSHTITIETTMSEFPTGPGGWAQGGLWFGAADNFGRGTSQDDYIKLIVGSPTSGTYALQLYMEQGGAAITRNQVSLPSNLSSISLKLVADPINKTVKASYNLGNGDVVIQTFSGIPDAWFSFDQAGIDPSLNTRSMGGIFGTSRDASVPVTFTFDQFSITESTATGNTSAFTFDNWTFPMSSPTSMVIGPDNRLYVTEILGKIHAITLDHTTRTVLQDQVIDTIRSIHGGDRMTLGIAVDPASTPDSVVLWVSHSSGSINNGAANSGVVSRLSGSNFATNEDRITGLPRAIANHAINSIHFGPDGKLYIAAGGNTGAGAPNLSGSEFGDRPEQPLSAGILVADVNKSGFQGTCATPIGQFGIPVTCDVQVYASGMRNPYDFVWHHNGSLYAPDNGLGVTGTYPPFPTPDCTGLADPNTNNPGVQPDLLYRVVQGKYYGHPNPYRNECVFKDGSYQGVAPLPNYQPPLFNLGDHRSADGAIEYNGDAFYSKLMGQLLIANYSVGDNITSIKLSSDGTSVVGSNSLVAGFQDPLPLAQDQAGNIYVGEMTAQRVTVLEPLPMVPAPTGGWVTKQSLPQSVLDAGGAALNDKFYMVAGKNSSAHISTLSIYNPVANSWTTGPDLPGVAVENPAVAAYNGKLYAFGGSTDPFSGAVANAAVYNPATNSWTTLTPMNTARGGATAQVIGNKIYVVGGMATDGSSLDSVEIYDPANNNWISGPSMQTRRDNPGSAVFNNHLYVFGGRTRNADGTVINGTLATMEIFDAAANSWSFGASMPTGRRTMVVGTISGRAQVMGGESPVFSQNEEYDPDTNTWRTLTQMSVPRHGAAAATIRGNVYVAGGGVVAGTSFSSANEAFAY